MQVRFWHFFNKISGIMGHWHTHGLVKLVLVIAVCRVVRDIECQENRLEDDSGQNQTEEAGNGARGRT